MGFTLVGLIVFVVLTLLFLVLGILSISHWNKVKDKKYSFIYLFLGILLISIFAAIYSRVIWNLLIVF